MTRATDVAVADVWRGSELAATITRTAHGSVFEYTDDFFASHGELDGGLAVHLPFRTKRQEVRGTNLHTYFAGLLPEGLRLRVLESRVKTSSDDLLSLLLAAGIDTVGDLIVVPHGESVPVATPPLARWKPQEVSFAEILAGSLEALATDPLEPSVPGVQQKVTASTIALPLKPAGRAAHLLKLNPPERPRLVENEHFFLGMARACGLRTARARLVHDAQGEPGLLVERFDRSWSRAARELVRVHQEDACQFLDRYPADKYRIGCADIASGLQETCAAPLPEILRFVRLVAFSYAIGDGDLHAKNVSILADGPAGGFRLSPAYDLPSTLPYGDRRMALRLDGRDEDLRRSHLVGFGARHGVPEAATVRMLDELCRRAAAWVSRVEMIGLDPGRTADLQRTMEKRLAQLAG